MPDHQIVVKLNKEQFEEAQRLAKLAGLRSATAYLREKILELLEDPKVFSELGSFALELPHRINSVDRDIERIQTDLQQFINESEQAGYDFKTRFDEQVNYFPEEESNHSESALNRRGNGETEFQSTIDLAASIGKSMADTVFDTTDNTTEPVIEASSYRNDDVEKNVWRADPQEDKTDQIEEEEMQAALDMDSITDSGTFNSQDQSQEPEMQAILDAVDEANDELEEMADRAFSISPRLGVIEPAGAALEADDPLADLLDEHLIDKLVLPQNQIVENQNIAEPDHQEEANNWATSPGLNTYQPAELKEEAPELEPEEVHEDEDIQSSEESPSQSSIKFEESENYDLEELKKLQEELNEVASGKIAHNSSQVENLPVKEEDEGKSKDENESDDEEEDEDEEPKFHDVSGGPPPKRRKF